MTGPRVFLAVFLAAAVALLNANCQIVKKIFSCEGRPSGYYADVQSGCQIYHMCDGLGRQFSYSCPNTTLFQQRMLICDHWYMVNCSKSETDYKANLLIGQKGKPFVEDDEENPYHRTPRPDLLANPSAAEYNIIYRSSRAQEASDKNLLEQMKEAKKEEDYFLPSHWSTEFYTAGTEKPKPEIKQSLEKNASPLPARRVNFESSFKATTPVYPKIAPTERPINEREKTEGKIKTVLLPPIGVNSGSKLSPEESLSIAPPTVNFESKFKATTPVYPKTAPKEVPLSEVEDNGRIKTVLLPPLTTEQKTVNFESNYKATTPVYPKSAPEQVPLNEEDGFDQGKPITILLPPISDRQDFAVNFESNYKATTPVYPTSVTPEIPLAFEEVSSEHPKLVPYGISSIIEPPKKGTKRPKIVFQSPFKATTPNYPKYAPSEIPLAFEETKVDPNSPNLSTVIQPPKSYVENKFNTIIQPPSLFYQPPAYNLQTTPKSKPTQENGKWQELRRLFLIPDFEFPLDVSAVRPGYNEGPSSFQVNPFTYGVMQRDHAYD